MIFLWRRRATTPRFTRAMAQSSSEIRKHAVQAARVLGTNMVRLPQVALPLGRLLGEDVALVGVAALVLAGSGLPEALGRRPIGLDLGHWGSLRNLELAEAPVLPCDSPCSSRSPHRAFHPALPVGKPLIPKESGRVLMLPYNKPGEPGRQLWPARVGFAIFYP